MLRQRPVAFNFLNKNPTFTGLGLKPEIHVSENNAKV
jgi:hypothetical protein